MKFFNFLFFTFLVLGCDELSFIDSETQRKSLIDSKTIETMPEITQDNPNKTDQVSPSKELPPENKNPDEILEEETTFISEDMELTKDTASKTEKLFWIWLQSKPLNTIWLF